MQDSKYYTVDLTKAEGRGEIRCPKCGIEISPDDETEDAYSILEAVMNKGSLEKIALQCNKCGIQILLTGLQASNQ